MKLTQRQLDKISGIISEAAEVRKNLREDMYENRKKSVVHESFLFEDADPSKLPAQLVETLDDVMMSYSQDILAPLNRKVYAALSNMYYSMTGKRIIPAVLNDNLQELNAYKLEVDLVHDIKLAIDRYVLAIGKLAVEESGVDAPDGIE